MAEELISSLGYWAPQSDAKHQKLVECVVTGNSKVYTEKKIKELNKEEVEKLFNNYEARLSGQMVKSSGRSIINMYSMGACSVQRITNQEALSKDLENNPFLNSALQRFTCELYYRFQSFLAPLSVGIIMSRHYLLSEHNKNREGTRGQVKQETIKMEEMRKQSSKSEVIGSFIGMGMVGFCFGIEHMLLVKTVNNLECFMNRKCL